jgi:hypothetical protein
VVLEQRLSHPTATRGCRGAIREVSPGGRGVPRAVNPLLGIIAGFRAVRQVQRLIRHERVTDVGGALAR